MDILNHDSALALPATSLHTRLLCSQHGAMVLETALVMPVFCLLLFGTFLFTMALISYCSATYAVNTGVRYASVSSNTSLSPASTTQVANVIKQYLFMPGTPNPTVQVYYGTPGNTVGNFVVGVVTVQEGIKTPFGQTYNFQMQVQATHYITR